MYTTEQIKIIEDGQKNGQTLQQIASRLGKTPAALRVYLVRNGYALKKQVSCPIVEKLIRIKFADPTWFRTNRAFYAKVKISQKRFSDLRAGYANPTEEELKRIAKVLCVSSDDLIELFKSRRLDLFDEKE